MSVVQSNLSPTTQEAEPVSPALYQYGWFGFNPKFLQKILNNAKAFLVLLTLANIMQGAIVNGLLKVNVTSIERRFNLLSSESGLIISAYDIAGCISLLPISYLGGRGHKPRWIGVGLLLTSFGTLMLALPHFITEPYQYSSDANSLLNNNTTSSLCKRNNSEVSRQMSVTVLPENVSSNGTLANECEGQEANRAAYMSLTNMKYVLFFGQFVVGLGSTPLAVLAVTFIDDSVDPPVYPIYIGIYYMGALVGPALGFIIGGRLLHVFTEVGVTPEDITVDSPRWVGAWWVGFVIGAIVLFILSIPILGYPKHLPCTLTRRSTLPDITTTDYTSGHYKTSNTTRVSEDYLPDDSPKEQQPFQPVNTTNVSRETSPRPYSATARRIITGEEATLTPRNLWLHFEVFHRFFCDFVDVMTNKAFIFLSLAAAVTSTIVSGFLTFGPKYVEAQFGKSASDAANLFGYVCIPAGAGGMLLGAALMTGFKMPHKASLTMCFAVSVIGLFALFSLTLHCEDVSLAGLKVPYNKSSGKEPSGFPSSSCNSRCSCLSNVFDPVCGNNGVTYYSPCFAACTQASRSSLMTYSDCACIFSPPSKRGNSTVPVAGTATIGKCPITCKWYNLILFGLFLVISTTFMCAIPGADLSLRCFPHRLRSLCIGIQWILIRTLGTIPGPIIFGAMIDSTCLIWSKQGSCTNGKGACLMYKNEELSFSLLILSVIYKGACIIFFGFALFWYKAVLHNTESFQPEDGRLSESPL